MTTTGPPRHLARARQELLLRELELRGSVRASELAHRVGVTEVTIRRDIIALERVGRVARVHGGAVSIDATTRPEAARSLVGLVLPGAGSHFPDVVRGIDAASPGLRARTVLASTNYRAETERRHVRRLVDLGIDGLIIAPTLRGRTMDDLVDMLAEVPVPLVILERRLEGSGALAGYDWVGTDHGRGALLAAEHLAAAGYERVGLAMLDRTPTAPLLREGFRRAVAQLGLLPAPTRSLPKDDGGEADPADAALEEFLEACLAAEVRAAIVHTDHHASRLVEISLDRGLRIPEDLALISYDDEFAKLCLVPLTAVAPPGREIGRLAIQTLVDRLGAEDPEPAPPRHVQVVPRLIERGSTWPVP